LPRWFSSPRTPVCSLGFPVGFDLKSVLIALCAAQVSFPFFLLDACCPRTPRFVFILLLLHVPGRCTLNRPRFVFFFFLCCHPSKANFSFGLPFPPLSSASALVCQLLPNLFAIFFPFRGRLDSVRVQEAPFFVTRFRVVVFLVPTSVPRGFLLDSWGKSLRFRAFVDFLFAGCFPN